MNLIFSVGFKRWEAREGPWEWRPWANLNPSSDNGLPENLLSLFACLGYYDRELYSIMQIETDFSMPSGYRKTPSM